MVDDVIALLRRGYLWSRGRAPARVTRFAGQRAVVVAGEQGAAQLYDTERMSRAGAVPAPVSHTLFGKGAVHGLDGELHAVRKAMFVSLLTPAAVRDITDRAARRWDAEISTWPWRSSVAVAPTAAMVLGGAVFDWAGLAGTPAQTAARSRALWQVVDGFGSVGLARARAVLARRRSQSWLQAVVEGAREGRAPMSLALRAVTAHRDVGGDLLDARTAAVELHNIIRPTVAVSWFVSYAVMAMAVDAGLRSDLAGGDDETLEAFAHELRRLYPFVPVLAARATTGFRWQGVDIGQGDLVVLDVYGSHHDEHSWPSANQLSLSCFRGREPGPFELLAQGGGDARAGHRCPGERLAIELVKDASRRIAAAPWASAEPNGMPSLRRMPPDVRRLRLHPLPDHLTERSRRTTMAKTARIANAAAASSRSDVGARGGHSPAYEQWTVTELRRRAAEIGIRGRSAMNKAELVRALRDH